ncbi:LysM peptidoglycan-binding domain-containing protein [Limosilactobacillus kribbianus]|uniref:aggregation-promoting factor n=1 Tax=Limosilactobacillus kribbianus TaxID=2982695 RepID=UPI0022648E0A|nr:LysM peptidoglycan-binding domain-containing protein [Limosilactobacillus kribbianus]
MISKKNFVKAATTLGAMALGVTAVTTVANADSVYTVKSGDTLSSISYKFAKNNSLVNSIARDNHISNINQIFVGQRLVIKGVANQQTGQSTSTATPASTNTTASTTATTTSSTNSSSTTSTVSGSEAAAKAWIANRESGGSYSAMNGQYVGKYQLSASYLGGDYSAANQERVADQYVASRYGSWTAAQQFWQANGWY